MKNKFIYLGRFSPFHIGHQKLVEKLLEKQRESDILIMVGSSNTYNIRTPYTFDERQKMINKIFPNIEVVPLPDGKPGLMYFDGSTNDIWLGSIKKIEKSRRENFIFVGGCKRDLEILAQGFQTVVLLDRDSSLVPISATQVREALKNNDSSELERQLDPRIVPLARAGFKNFINSQRNEGN